MAAQPVLLWVDVLRKILPKWLTERIAAGFVVAFRTLFTMVSRLDAGTEILVQLTNARYPGVGTPTALPLIGQSRGLIRGIGETTAAFALYLRQWRELWRHAGQQAALAKAVSHYCGGVKVKSINRGGTLVTVDVDGTVTTQFGVTWDWDSKSNPEKSGHWSELWLIVFTPPWPRDGKWGAGEKWGSSTLGFGHDAPRVDVDAIRGLLLDWKRNSSRVNCIIFTYDATLFDETTPATMPDGYFGKWSKDDPAHPGRRIRSRFTDCRYWEPHPYFSGVLSP